MPRPTYIAAEVVTAAATTGGYSFVADSVSRLGEVGCTASYCSPRHEVMNGAFMVYGVALSVGALLLAKQSGRGDRAARGVGTELVRHGAGAA